MKKFNKLLLNIAILCCTYFQVYSQSINCNAEINFSLDGSGIAIVDPSQVIEGALDPALNYEISSDGTNFSPTVTLDCSDIGESQLTVRIVGTTISCWGTAIIEDRKKPTPYCYVDFEIEFTDGIVELAASEADAGSFDNCSEDLARTFGAYAFDHAPQMIGGILVDRTVDHYFDQSGVIAPVSTANAAVVADYNAGLIQRWSASELTSYQIFTAVQMNSVNIVMAVTDDSGNFDYCITSFAALPGNVVVSTAVVTNIFNCSIDPLLSTDFILEDEPYTLAFISLDGNDYATSISDADLEINEEVPLYVKYRKGEENYFNVTKLTAIDQTPPVVVVEQELTVTLLSDGFSQPTASISVDDINKGSFDNCSDLTLSLSQTMFDISDIGINNVILTATDAYGNSNQAWTEVTVLGPETCDAPAIDLVSWPRSYIQVHNAPQDAEEFDPELLISSYGYDENDVNPFTLPGCTVSVGEDRTYTSVGNEWTITRTFTVINNQNSTTATFTQFIENIDEDIDLGLICVGTATVFVDEEPYEVFAPDLAIGTNYEVGDLVLFILDPAGNIREENIITIDDIGKTFTYGLKRVGQDDFCSGTLAVLPTAYDNPCLSGPGESFFWPLAEIQIDDSSRDPSELSPVILQSEYGYDADDVRPLLTTECSSELLLAYAYEDQVILSPSLSGRYLINRTFTVIDWATETVWSFDQVIKNTTDPFQYICDFLPRTAPFGNCELGHTADDDIEWPGHISVADHRLNPAELVSISGIDILDSEPSFYDDDELYSHSFSDKISNITSTQIEIERLWTVQREDGSNLTWTFAQNITVDYTNFENIISTTLGNGQAIPNVIVNNDIMTNESGKAILVDQEVESLNKVIEFSTGIDLLDFILIKRHILQLETLGDHYALAADINKDGDVKASDLVLLRKNIVKVEENLEGEFLFVEQQISSGLNPKGNYIGVKLGDVNDSHSTPPQKVDSDYNLMYNDQLINAGEDYSVHISLNKDAMINVADIIFALDESVMDDVIVESDIAEVSINIKDGNLHLLYDPNQADPMSITEGDAIVSITFSAASNGILSEALRLSDEFASVFIDENREYQLLGSEVNGVISSVFDDPNNPLSFVDVYPNPAQTIVNFNFKKAVIENPMIEIFDNTGRLVLAPTFEKSIDVTELPSGIYSYRISNDGAAFISKIAVVK